MDWSGVGFVAERVSLHTTRRTHTWRRLGVTLLARHTITHAPPNPVPTDTPIDRAHGGVMGCGVWRTTRDRVAARVCVA